MTFLEMCAKVTMKSGLTAAGPSTVTGQSGILAKIVEWVYTANREVQRTSDWLFLRTLLEVSLTPNVKKYLYTLATPLPIKAIRKAWVNGSEVPVKSWDWYLNESAKEPSVNGSPKAVVRAPDSKGFFVFPTPDDNYTIKIDASIAIVNLVNNQDVSIIPEHYHEAVIHRALMFYAEYEEDQYRYQQATIDYDFVTSQMAATELPEIKF